MERNNICDRCGAEFDYLSTNKQTKITPVILHIGTGYKVNTLNLCGDCQEELKNWIEKGMNNGAT